jgi:hypothetical protein
MLSDILIVLGWVLALIGMCFVAYFFSILGEVWRRFDEYEAMKARGFKMMRSEDGDDFWVGYED